VLASRSYISGVGTGADGEVCSTDPEPDLPTRVL